MYIGRYPGGKSCNACVYLFSCALYILHWNVLDRKTEVLTDAWAITQAITETNIAMKLNHAVKGASKRIGSACIWVPFLHQNNILNHQTLPVTHGIRTRSLCAQPASCLFLPYKSVREQVGTAILLPLKCQTVLLPLKYQTTHLGKWQL